MRTRFRSIGHSAVLLGALLSAGCSRDTLYSDLSEREVNEMAALLFSAGVDADKIATGDGRFALATSPTAFADAVAVLQANGLPRAEFESLGSVFAREGFVSSPMEERARLNHAISEELAHTISSIDGVIVARVHLALPEQDALRGERLDASCSVFVKHRADHDLSEHLGQIKALVVNSVESLPYENVTVALFPAEEGPVTRARQPELANAPRFDAGRLEALRTGLSQVEPGVWLIGSVTTVGGVGLLAWSQRRRGRVSARSAPTNERS